jgi:hypothetical protein
MLCDILSELQVGAQEGVIAALLQIISTDSVDMYVSVVKSH